MNLNNTVVAITGAGGGLGAAMAENLSGLGARLALLDYRADAIEEVKNNLGLADDRCLCLPCDVTDEQAVDQAIAKIPAHFGRFDVLINNAGLTRDSLLIKSRDGELQSRMQLSDWNAVIDVNLTGVFLCARAAAEHMAASGEGGAIINISSISRNGNAGQSNYTASKAGVAAMTVTWSKELARYGIRVNAISPGFINTRMVQAMKPAALDKLKNMIPIRRLGSPDEIAHTVEFIIENDFVNGRNLEVDGGMRI
jgi:3-oxoacyl-[acyl-carrier protein] reductase